MNSSGSTAWHGAEQVVATKALNDLMDEAYGPIAPAPPRVTARLLHRAVVARWGDATLDSLRVAWGAAHGEGFVMQVMRPATRDACPVIVSGDACWACLTEAVVAAAAQAGVALAWFNRTEVHSDPPPEDRAAIDALLRAPPQGMAALASWAWALQRAVDVLAVDTPGIDATRIAVAGHSRGGKAALVAAALDTRIALVAANNSGTLGAASSFVGGEGRETVSDLVRRFPHWVGERLRAAVTRGETAVPAVEQHVLLASIAPRALLITQATDDRWANPQGTRHAVERARELAAAYDAAGAPKLIERLGGHAQTTQDWLAVIGELNEARVSVAPASKPGVGVDARVGGKA